MKNQFKKLIVNGKAVAFIDWANVHGWEKTLKREPDPVKLFAYLKRYSEISDFRFYFGRDMHPKSSEFLKTIERTGYTLITKPVKYILVATIGGQKIYRRKCDFDMETCIDTHQALQAGYDSFIFFTGDGDYEPLYKLLIKLGKQVIVIYTAGHLGREIWSIERGLFKAQLKNLMDV